MKTVILLTGGSRSGKSRMALELAAPYKKKAFIATAEPIDDEMKERIRKHQAERGSDFVNIEAPVDIAGALRSLPDDVEIAIVDCLTVWLNNLMYHFGEDKDSYTQVDELAEVIKNPSCPIIFVTNETGMGIIPDNRLSRRFRDLAGWLNQRIASLATKVIFMVSGLPLTLKDVNHGQTD